MNLYDRKGYTFLLYFLLYLSEWRREMYSYNSIPFDLAPALQAAIDEATTATEIEPDETWTSKRYLAAIADMAEAQGDLEAATKAVQDNLHRPIAQPQ